MSIRQRVEQYKDAVNTVVTRYNLAVQKEIDETAELANCKQDELDSLAAQATIQDLAEIVQQATHERIAVVVSRCLTAVFDDPYELRIRFVQKRGKTEAELSFLRAGLEVDPLTASGGGVVDVAAFALRIAAVVLGRPQVRRLILLDEPFRFVSERFRPRIAELLVTLAEELQIQFVLVTHFREFSEIGTVVNL